MSRHTREAASCHTPTSIKGRAKAGIRGMVAGKRQCGVVRWSCLLEKFKHAQRHCCTPTAQANQRGFPVSSSPVPSSTSPR